MTVAKVMLWGTEIGTVALPEGSSVARFEYDSDFITSGIQVAPLTMPLSRQVYSFPALPEETFHGLPGMLADSLPDKFGTAVINRWLESQGRSGNSLNAIERLCYTGSRGMGALEYLPATGPKQNASEQIELEALTRLADEILSERMGWHAHAGADALAQIIQVGTSAGGARAKAIVAYNESSGDIRSGQIDAGPGYGYWIVKFDGIGSNSDRELSDEPGYTRREYAYYLMAQHAGIEMSECRLLPDGKHAHFITKRFDRDADTGGKIHMLSLGGMAHFDFRDPESYSYEGAVQVMRRLEFGQDAVEQLFRRMVFNIMARNQDDHVKNVSFLMDKDGKWRLSPAYDVTYAYNPQGKWTSLHQMSANGKRGEFTLSDIMQTAEHMSIRKAKARAIVAEVASAIGKWFDFAETAGMAEQDASAIGKTHIGW